MRTRQHLRDFIGMCAWGLFARWSKLHYSGSLTPGERAAVVRAVIPAVFRNRYVRPVGLRLLAKSPSWIVARRLQRRHRDWYRVPTRAAAEHLRLRFDIWPVEVGDHVRIARGRLTAIAHTNATFSEI